MQSSRREVQSPRAEEAGFIGQNSLIFMACGCAVPARRIRAGDSLWSVTDVPVIVKTVVRHEFYRGKLLALTRGYSAVTPNQLVVRAGRTMRASAMLRNGEARWVSQAPSAVLNFVLSSDSMLFGPFGIQLVAFSPTSTIERRANRW